MTIDEVQSFITNPNITAKGFRVNNKASEKYVDVVFLYPDSAEVWHGWIPYHYRRAGLEINGAQELANFIGSIYPSCESSTSS